VYLGRMVGPRGFTRLVAVKRLHTSLLHDARFVSMLVEEALVASHVRHPNVVPALDVVEDHGEVLIVSDYVEGETLSKLLQLARARDQWPSVSIVTRIVVDLLRGLEAAHEAAEDGRPLHIVHCDVSPQNVMLGVDGQTRVVDFGIAKAADQARDTREGEVKGKMRYIAPEQLEGVPVDRRADIFAAGVVLWEALTKRPFRPPGELSKMVAAIVSGEVRRPSEHVEVSHELEEIVLRALARKPDDRFSFAGQMADALEQAERPASAKRRSCRAGSRPAAASCR